MSRTTETILAVAGACVIVGFGLYVAAHLSCSDFLFFKGCVWTR